MLCVLHITFVAVFLVVVFSNFLDAKHTNTFVAILCMWASGVLHADQNTQSTVIRDKETMRKLKFLLVIEPHLQR